MRKTRPFNDLGLWLAQELARRNLSRTQFALLLHTTPQNLSDLLHGDRFRPETRQRWEIRFREMLMIIDQRQTTVCEEDTIYQVICTEITVEDSRCFTYGLQVLIGTAGHYRIADEMRDISPDPAAIWALADRCNMAKLSRVHFRDVVMDSIA